MKMGMGIGIEIEIEREYGVVLHDQDHFIINYGLGMGPDMVGAVYKGFCAKNTGPMNVEEHELRHNCVQGNNSGPRYAYEGNLVAIQDWI